MKKNISSEYHTLKGELVPPGDKSISHRALIFGALGEGQSIFRHFLEADDCLRTSRIFQSLGVPIQHDLGKGQVVVKGVGLRNLQKPKCELDCGNSGTSMRLLLGVLAGQPFEATLVGDQSLSARPMARVTRPLKQMGAQIKGREKGNYAPLQILGGHLRAIDFENKIASAQVKSALLFAGLYAEGKTQIREWIPSRDHTERLLIGTGANYRNEESVLVIERTDRLLPLEMEIPGDFSSAAFFIAGAAFSPGSELVVKKVGLNPTRTGLLNVLKRMGADLEVQVEKNEPEPIGTICIRGKRLIGTRIIRGEIPSLIDELPILMTALALAEGESLISGAEELRVKETDRIHSMVHNLLALGAVVQELPDGCLIKGVEAFRSGQVQGFGDHRTIMSLAMATLAMKGDLTIQETDCIETSFPTFFDEFDRLRGIKKRA